MAFMLEGKSEAVCKHCRKSDSTVICIVFRGTSTTQNLKTSNEHVNLLRLLLSWKNEDHEFLFSVCQICPTLWLARGKILCSKSQNVQPQLFFQMDWSSMTLQMDHIGLFHGQKRKQVMKRSKQLHAWDDLTKLKDIVNKSDAMKPWTLKERGSIQNGDSMRWEISCDCCFLQWNIWGGVPKPLMKNRKINCLTSEKKTRQKKNTVKYWPLLPFLCSCCLLARNWKLDGGNFVILQFTPQ